MNLPQEQENFGAPRPLMLREIIAFWLPLTTTWLLMAFESPYINAVIARMHEPKENLAGFGVGLAIALIIETPVLMLLTTTTTLLSGPKSFHRLRRLMQLANLLTIIGMTFISLPPVFNFISTHFLSVPPNVASLAHLAICCLIPWPSAVGYRRFYQGVMIKHGFTRYVAVGTMIRLLGMGSCCMLLFLLSNLPGAMIGAISISCGVTAEALFAKFSSKNSVAETLQLSGSEDKELPWPKVLNVYLPLTFTILIIFSYSTVHTYFASRGPLPTESLATIPVVGAISFFIFSLAFSMQETVIVLGKGHDENMRSLKKFVTVLSAVQVLTMMLLALTPLGGFGLSSLSGLKGELLELGTQALKMHIVLPALATWIVWNKALVLKAERAKFVTISSALELGLVILLLPIVMRVLEIPGALAVPITMSTTALTQILYFQIVRRTYKIA